MINPGEGQESMDGAEASPSAQAAAVSPAPVGDPFSAVRPRSEIPILRRVLRALALAVLILAVALAGLAVYEASTSRLQARYFSRIGGLLWFNPESGATQKIRFPTKGPTDERRGYVRIPAFTAALRGLGYQVESQARFSPKMLEYADRGVHPPYREKTQAGLRLMDSRGQAMFTVNYPLKIYPHFDSIPGQIVNTLLFIENRTLLDSSKPFHNPAVEWSRMAKAGADFARSRMGKEGNVAGGSTLATQLEKFKHSEEGRTLGPKDKYLQMLSASLRAYLEGGNTMEARKRILLDYVNSVPLAALPGYGEVNGLSDGLLAWYGASLDSVNRLLKSPRGLGAGPDGVDPGVDMDAMGRGYRQVLNLFIAHRRPTSYLLQHREALTSISENYLRVLGREGVISPQLRDAALRSNPELMRRAAAFFPAAFVERKHVNSVRTSLLSMLGLPRLYDLDRLDLSVATTLDGDVQKAVVHTLRRLSDPAFVDSAGLKAFRMLDKGDPSKVIYSFTLYETSEGKNLLRVQADNYDQPLNINEGVKLDLGSTAKLRTTVNYLEIVSEVGGRLRGKSQAELLAAEADAKDGITRWVAGYLASLPPESASAPADSALTALLEAAMEREYSASPAEKFFTGGGVHTFVNFNPADKGMKSVKEAFRQSVNLVFIRMMRDIVNYHIAQAPVSRESLIDSSESSHRQAYLEKFAEQEGQLFLGRFFRKYRGLDPRQIREAFFHGVRPAPRRIAAAYLAIQPKADTATFAAFMREQLGDSLYSGNQLSQLYRQHFQDAFGLADLGYVAGVHPLELWLVGHLLSHPRANWSQVREASRAQIQETYRWLFRTRHRGAQDSRIRSIMELEAFLEIHRSWQRLGYPFGSLVPSYATSIGSSADRPNALAELVGIILNDGIRYPSVLVERLRFAEGTPYETAFQRADTSYKRLLSPEICRVLKSALLDVVDHGTAVRGHRSFPVGGGEYLRVGGKTGTGDQRFETYGRGGQLLESRIVNRTATFVFILGDRFFGTLTAHVPGEDAGKFGFTSSLPVALLKLMAPDLMPLLTPRTRKDRPEDFPIALPEDRNSRPAPPSLRVPWRPSMNASTLSRMLLGPAVPDTNALSAPIRRHSFPPSVFTE